MEGDGGTDAVPVAVALQHRPIGVVEVVRRVGTPPMDGAGVGAGAGAGVVALPARGFCRRPSPVSSSSRVRLRLIPVEGPAERFDARASCA